MNKNLALKKIRTDFLLLVFVSLVILLAYFSTSEDKVNLNWGVGILSFIALGIVTRRFKLSGFQSNPKLGLTDCASLDDFENWFRLFIMIILIPFIPIDLVVQTTNYLRSKA